MTTIPEFFTATAIDPNDSPLRTDLMAMIQQRYEDTPRNKQVELGPSEVGHPCMRKMAYGIMQVPRQNPEYNPLPSIIGTATHTWLQTAAMHANNQLGRERWKTETRVQVTPGLFGHSDLYDHDTATVIDWKVPGKNRFDLYRDDPGPVFKGQVMMYGLGFENAGLPVKRVAICLVPRDGRLRDMHVWQADYDREQALEILKRRDQVINLIVDLDVENNPDRYEWFPKHFFDCVWCPAWRPEPRNGFQCKGDQ